MDKQNQSLKKHRGKLIAIGTILLGIIGFLANITGILGFFGIDMASKTPTPTKTITPTITFTITSTVTPTLLPTPSQTPTPITFELVSMTSEVKRGAVASVSIRTTPNTVCILNYFTPKGDPSDAQGLGRTTSDELGTCFWAWSIGPGTSLGEGRIEIIAREKVESYPITIIK